MNQQSLVTRSTKNSFCKILLSIVVLGTLIASCYRMLSLQQSLPSNHIIVHEIVLKRSATSSTADVKTDVLRNQTSNASVTHQKAVSATATDAAKTNQSTLVPLHPPPSSVIQQQGALNASRNCTAPFSRINGLPKRRIFVDFGANDGHSVELFLNSSTLYWNEIEHYSKRVANIRRSNITGAMLGWEVHVFEANPNKAMKRKREALQLHLVSNNLTQSYQTYDSTAITTYDGFIEFILDNNHTGSSGSTTMSESASARGRKVNVTAVDIVTFFKNLQIREMDELVIKMDVEGAEYALCRRMIDYCLFPLIDRIGIEWHHSNNFVFGFVHHEKYKTEHKNIMEELVERGWQDKVLEWA